MELLQINRVRTGPGLAGSRVALIEAPAHAGAGSLVALTQFINAQDGLRASAGYAGEDKAHVLRISGLQSDAQLTQLLQQGFPAWQTTHVPSNAQHIAIAPNVRVSSIMDHEADNPPHAVIRFMRNNADRLAGLTYGIGSVAFLLSGLGNKAMSGAPKVKDPLRTTSAIGYLISSTLLVVLAKNPENARDVYTILEEQNEAIKNADGATKEGIKQTVDDVWKFTKNYSWEIASAFSGAGAVAQIASAKKTGRTGEMLSICGTLAAMAIAVLVPEKGGRSVLEALNFGKRNEALEATDLLEREQLDVEKLKQNAGGIINHLRENPLGISAGIQAISNAAYGVAAFLPKQTDWSLAALSGTSLLGNVFQAFATKGRGHGMDDVVSAAAESIMKEPEMQNQQAGHVRERAVQLAKRLVREPEITQQTKPLARAIERRVLQRQSETPPSEAGMGAYTKRERATMRQSPFLQPQHRAAVTEQQQTNTALPAMA